MLKFTFKGGLMTSSRLASLFLVPLLSLNALYGQLLDAPQYRSMDPRVHRLLRAAELTPRKSAAFGQEAAALARITPGLTRHDGEELYPVVIMTSDADAVRTSGIRIESTLPDRVTARVGVDDLIRLSRHPGIRYVELAREVLPFNDVASGLTGARLLNDGYLLSTPFKGSGVIVGVLDTGIDWAHLDFRDTADTTKSRILAIWDQTLTATGGESPPSGYSYGVEYTRSHIEDELDGSPTGFVRERDTNGHGTHVTGTAAGNGAALASQKYAGMAPEADIIFVKAGNSSFPTTNIVDGLAYFQAKATELGRPIVVNLSLGTDYGPHDGTRSMDVAIDNFAGVGRVAVVSAGNSGSSAIHVSGTVAAFGTQTVSFTVPTYTPVSGNFNDAIRLNVWFADSTDISVQIISPAADTIMLGAGVESETLTASGTVFAYNFVDGSNFCREIFVSLYDSVAAQPPASGTWTLRFINGSGNASSFHGWTYDPTLGSPSVTVMTSGADANYTLGNTAAEAIIVGSYAHRWAWWSGPSNGPFVRSSTSNRTDTISSFSSRGPTRTGMQKPDIAAPGEAMVSSLSRDAVVSNNSVLEGNKHWKNQGTSMSSPVVAGCVALLLERSPTLSASDVLSLLTSTTVTDAKTGNALPDDAWGYGKANVFKAMQKLIDSEFPRAFNLYAYDDWGGESSVALNAGERGAVRFTPSADGRLVGAYIHTSSTLGWTGSVSFEIWSDNGSGLPSALLGSSVSIPASSITRYSWNYIPMDPSGVSVTGSADYHLVVSFASGGQSFIRYDNILIDGRSSIYTGGSWSAYGNDLRLRAVVANDATALPVQMAGFTVTNAGSTAIIRWSTATETDNTGWDVERRRVAADPPGIHLTPADWTKVGFVEGAGTSTSSRDYHFGDTPPMPGRWAYRLKQLDRHGSYRYTSEVEVELGSAPARFALEQNFPNPFNPTTEIRYQIPDDGHVRLSVFDLLGREVAVLVDEKHSAGRHAISWNASGYPSGLYVVALRCGKARESTKMVLSK